MRTRPPVHRLALPLLLAALAACDRDTPDLPTGARAHMGQAGIATRDAVASVIGLAPSPIDFTLVRPVPGTPGEQAPRTVIFYNTGTGPVNWTATGSQPWLSATPDSGELKGSSETVLDVVVNTATLAAGSHTGTVTVRDLAFPHATAQVGVSVNVVEPTLLDPEATRTGISGTDGSERYFAVLVPPGTAGLRIAAAGSVGHTILYARSNATPMLFRSDCNFRGDLEEDACEISSPPAGAYYVLVRGYQNYSGLRLWTTTQAPAPPTRLRTVPVEPTKIEIRWTDGSRNESHHFMSRRSLSPGGAWSEWSTPDHLSANPLAIVSSGLTAGVTYQFRVQACNAAGCSAWVNGVPVTIPTTPPAAPTDLVALPTSATAVALTWRDRSRVETEIRLTRALRSLDGSWGAYGILGTLDANTTSFTDTGVQGGRQYRYRVAACNGGACSIATSDIVATPPVPGVPRTVGGTVVGPGTIRVHWTDGSGAETSFELQRATVNDGRVGTYGPVATLPPAPGVYSVQVYSDAGLGAGSYRYRLRSCNPAGCSAWVASGDIVLP